MDSNALTPLLTDLIQALVALLLGAVVFYIRQHFTVAQLDTAERVAEIVVGAVEQMGAAGLIDPAAKKRQAIERMQELGARFGLKLSYEQCATLIEVAVKDLKDAGVELRR